MLYYVKQVKVGINFHTNFSRYSNIQIDWELKYWFLQCISDACFHVLLFKVFWFYTKYSLSCSPSLFVQLYGDIWPIWHVSRVGSHFVVEEILRKAASKGVRAGVAGTYFRGPPGGEREKEMKISKLLSHFIFASKIIGGKRFF